MRYVGIVHTSAVDEIPVNAVVRGKRPEQYGGGLGLKWLLVKLANGVNRRILVRGCRKEKC